VGERGATIARLAGEISASLVVMGAETPPLLAGVRPGQTLAELVGMARTPLLIVPPGASVPPRSALVGVDFDELSLSAARAAAGLLEPGGTLHLVHVAREAGSWAEELYEPERGLQPAARLAALGRELCDASGGALRVETRVARGDPALDLLATADRLGVELVALGTHGEGFAGEPLTGRVSAAVVHGASCCVLVFPPRAGADLPWETAAQAGQPQPA
jgi:nucleotide-binding universal stress UspA family protein